MTFVESSLEFSFPRDWVVIKFDTHKFFRILSGEGLKGVDFIGFDAAGDLFLMEVKNYRNKNLHDGINPSQHLLDYPDIAIEEYLYKIEDSLRLIEVANKYYGRRWWNQTFGKKILKIFPRWSKRLEWGFWQSAFHLPKTRQHYQLFLQLDNQVDQNQLEQFYQLIQIKYQERFTDSSDLTIFNLNSNFPFSCRMISE